MKKRWLIAVGCILLVSLSTACSTKNMTDRQARAEAMAAKRLGQEYLRYGQNRKALAEFIKAEAALPDDYILQDDLGLAYYYLGDTNRAIAHFKKALEIKEDYSPARNNLGNAYAQQQQWDKAIEQYKLAVSDLLYATPYMPLMNIGFAYYQKKNYTLSEVYYLKALKLRPDFVNALRGLARTYIATGRQDMAIARLEKAARLAPESTPVLFDLAEAYRHGGDYQKAYDLYQQIVKMAPASALAEKAQVQAGKIQHLVQP